LQFVPDTLTNWELGWKSTLLGGRLQSNGYNSLPRVLQPGYSVMNLRFGLDQTEGRWMTEFYITNLTNKNAVIYTNEGNFDLRYTRNEPRVFGARVSYRWGKRGSGAGGE
jgi:outer membrane receptor protein involved in Fe transport